MALAGLRPVVEMRVVDFALCAMDEIVNQAAKNRFMFGGQGRVPLVMRACRSASGSASAAQHSQSLEAWFAHLPGVVVVCPATPQDNYSLLRAAHADATIRWSTWSTRSCGACAARSTKRSRCQLGQARRCGAAATRSRS